jgi:hypothetical protein
MARNFENANLGWLDSSLPDIDDSGSGSVWHFDCGGFENELLPLLLFIRSCLTSSFDKAIWRASTCLLQPRSFPRGMDGRVFERDVAMFLAAARVCCYYFGRRVGGAAIEMARPECV